MKPLWAAGLNAWRPFGTPGEYLQQEKRIQMRLKKLLVAAAAFPVVLLSQPSFARDDSAPFVLAQQDQNQNKKNKDKDKNKNQNQNRNQGQGKQQRQEGRQERREQNQGQRQERRDQKQEQKQQRQELKKEQRRDAAPGDQRREQRQDLRQDQKQQRQDTRQNQQQQRQDQQQRQRDEREKAQQQQRQQREETQKQQRQKPEGRQDDRQENRQEGRRDGKPGGGDRARKLDDVRGERREFREGNRKVIQEGNRAIVQDGNRKFIRHDENARFRRVGRDVNVQRFGNETRTFAVGPNGTRIVTVTDANGRLLRRSRFVNGREVIIIDNRPRGGRSATAFFVALPAIALATLAIPRERYIVEAETAPPEYIYGALMAPPVEPLPRAYTLDEIRYSAEVRDRMPRIDLDTITFESGSWEVSPDQYNRLAPIADGIKRAIAQNPNEVFLIEGHTDATGNDDDNLSLSDRRAELVSVILTDQFQIPPENLTTQGYGEQQPKVQTEGPERANRRVTIRRITPLLQQGQADAAPGRPAGPGGPPPQ